MFTVYSKPSCPACVEAKALLRSKDLRFTEIILDVSQQKIQGEKYITREAFLAILPNARTMPQVMKESDSSAVHIGGIVELKRYLHV
jgi:glutaredoxin